jgi:hypothetical protein
MGWRAYVQMKHIPFSVRDLLALDVACCPDIHQSPGRLLQLERTYNVTRMSTRHLEIWLSLTVYVNLVVVDSNWSLQVLSVCAQDALSNDDGQKRGLPDCGGNSEAQVG